MKETAAGSERRCRGAAAQKFSSSLRGILKGLWFTVTGVALAVGASQLIGQLLPGPSRVVTLTCFVRQKWKSLEECHQRGERGGRGLASEPGAAVAPEEQGTRCQAGSPAPACREPFRGRTKKLQLGCQFCRAQILNEKKQL